MKPVIYFDWDGTLCDSMQLCIEECRQALLTMGLPDLPDETLRKCNGPNDWDACEILGVPEAMKADYVRTRMEAGLALLDTVNRLFPGVREMLARLQPVADLAIVSNGQVEYLEKCRRVFDVGHFFARCQGYTPGKVKTQLLAGLLQEMQPRRAVMVGDRLGDLEAGKANGLLTVAACFGYGNEAEYAVADVCCRTVQELSDWLYAFAVAEE